MTVVLVVEDDASLREMVAEVLRSVGHRVLEADDGRRALELLVADGEVDVVLLDLMMPGVDGWTFRARQLDRPETAGVPVVVMSGAADLAAHAATLGAAGTLQKPFSIDDVLSTVEAFAEA